MSTEIQTNETVEKTLAPVTDEVLAMVEEYASLNAQMNAFKKRQDEIKDVLMALHESGHATIEASGAKSVFVAESYRISLDVDKFKTEEPAMYERFMTKSAKTASGCRITVSKTHKQ